MLIFWNLAGVPFTYCHSALYLALHQGDPIPGRASGAAPGKHVGGGATVGVVPGNPDRVSIAGGLPTSTSTSTSTSLTRTLLLTLLFTSYLFVYWIWDTCNSQKNRFRQQERGTFVPRKTFPQLPWQTVQNPEVIRTESGEGILVDGWYKYARKVHYTCDLYFVS